MGKFPPVVRFSFHKPVLNAEKSSCDKKMNNNTNFGAEDKVVGWGDGMGFNDRRGVSFYEYKLERVMKRLGVGAYTFNWDRWGCYVDFHYKGEHYRFEHSVEKARAKGLNLRNGSETFIEVVLTLEDLARIVERGIYGLETWVSGIKCHADSADEVPEYFKMLGFSEIPAGPEGVRRRYELLAREVPSDGKDSEEKLRHLKKAAEQAINYFGEKH